MSIDVPFDIEFETECKNDSTSFEKHNTYVSLFALYSSRSPHNNKKKRKQRNSKACDK